MTLQAGQLFGNYAVVRLIGEGGFGEVYLVENQLIQRRSAVKVLHPALAQDRELVRRFLNEARAASAICHPNIIEVFDAGVTPHGAPYILMEFLEGESLQKRLADRGRLPLPQVLDIAKQAGSALVAAHLAGIVHRDLKPENLFLVPDSHAPSGERVKVLDFGIAKICLGGGSGGTVRTQTGMIIGSPAYMSPEQCKDSADVDVRSDVYSFATILYEMLSGRTPHVAPTAAELLFLHLTGTPSPLRELTPQVPAKVEAVIMRGLAREREDRFDTMEAFVAALGDDWAKPAPIRMPTEIVSADGQSYSTVANRKALPARSTTFSRATGEIEEAAESEEAILATTRSRRWPAIALSAVAILGGVMLFLLRPNRDSMPRPMSHAGSGAAGSAAIAPPLPPPMPIKAADSQPLPTGGTELRTPNPPHAEASAKTEPSKQTRKAARPTTSRATAKEWNSAERWLAH